MQLLNEVRSMAESTRRRVLSGALSLTGIPWVATAQASGGQPGAAFRQTALSGQQWR